MARYFVLTYVVFLFAGDGVAADLPVLNGRKVPADGSIIGMLTEDISTHRDRGCKTTLRKTALGMGICSNFHVPSIF